MRKLTISTAELPAQLDDRARFRFWHESFCEWVVHCDMKRLSDEPFAMEWTFTELNEVRFGRVCGASRSSAVMPQHISSATRDMLALGFNLGASASWFSQRGELIRASGQPFLYSLTEAYRSAGATDALSVAIPRRALQAVVPDPESLLSVPLDGSLPAMRHLRRYLCMMNEPGSVADDQRLIDHVETTILDLAALALWAQRDVAELASMRGLRAARHAEIVRVIGKGFCDPAFSVQRVAIATGLSPSYIQKILHETGQSFTERVLELRLGKARSMLVSRKNDGLRIGEIALACGFSDISYFNRSFRRRFGAAPNECRGSGL